MGPHRIQRRRDGGPPGLLSLPRAGDSFRGRDAASGGCAVGRRRGRRPSFERRLAGRDAPPRGRAMRISRTEIALVAAALAVYVGLATSTARATSATFD